MSVKVRKQIYLDPQQEALLKRLSRETGASEAEIIRGCIDARAREFRPGRHDPAAWQAERDFIRHLIELGPVSPARRWRRDDLYDRKVLRRR